MRDLKDSDGFDYNRRRRSRKNDKMDAGFQRRQEAISPFGLRVASAISFENLVREGMRGIPDFQNGGALWMVKFLFLPEVRQLFATPERKQSEFTSQGSRTTFEEQFAQEQLRRSQQLGSPVKGTQVPLDGFIAQLMRAVAFAGATAAGAGVAAKVAGRFSAPQSPRGGGGGGKLFQAPTFRPGGYSRKKRAEGVPVDDSGSGQSVGELGPP